ncbi:LPXTG cell wall anchor domain-containing protein [Micromonospora purpureochromogenes]|uniref:LPXTG-motif cell wall-anchored protein n=1 Tax=Micromonospora purpureochromogenes TaxID=47872 RepID=A0ABX2RHH6_9ACTN|nr:LPXTG cell wall anchor domain-containing protein [Micromonospora purpureochromogenes]NYF55776.1 LPXTG-motif cell wall-anchored protein [Micromonospora purpureochromogenes]
MLLLLGGVGVPAASASAAPAGADLTVDLAGATIPLGVTKKTLHLKISNRGDATPTRVVVRVDASELDRFDFRIMLWPTGGPRDCDGDVSGWYCDLLPDQLPGPGETVELPILATVQTEEPLAGRIKVTVEVKPVDTNPADNTKWFPIQVVDHPEADLSVVAPDVTQSVRIAADGSLASTGTLNPGETGAVRYTIANQGRKPVDGVKVELRVPTGATFTRPPDECVLSDAGRAAVCTYDRLALVPVDQDTDPNDQLHSAVELYHLVTVSAATKAPVTLRNGTVRVEGLSDPRSDLSGPARSDLPTNAVAVRAVDVDDSDNQDGFAVVVAANSSGGGSGGSPGDGGGAGGGGSLPITGSQAGLTAGAGLAMLVGGGVLLLLTRRRRAIR